MSMVSIVEVDQDILDSARLTPTELKVEIAVHLSEQGRLSVGKARELADMTLWEFRQLLASRRIPPHYDETDLDGDVATLCELGQRQSLIGMALHPRSGSYRESRVRFRWCATDEPQRGPSEYARSKESMI